MRLKRNLILLIAIVSVSFKSFSQTDTKVVLTESIARLVVKDLVTYDGLLLEYKISREQIAALEGKVLTLNEVVTNIQLQLENRNQIIIQKDAQIENYKIMSEDLKKALARERRMKSIYKIGSVIGLAAVASKILL
jgi:hypothetical protein